MSKLFTSILVAFCCLATTTVFSQTVAWSYDFSADTTLPTGWVTTDASGQGFVWEYSTGGPIFGTQPIFCSASAADGFLLMNSDAGLVAGLPANHDSRVTTDAIDCSGLASVFVRFENQYAYFSTGGGSIAELGVSTDGVNFTYYPILTGVTNNDLTACVQVEEVDVTTQAAGQSTVYLQWRWQGNWEYAWRIDDITVQDAGAFVPPSSLQINSFNAPSTSFSFPINNADSLRFVADIENVGTATQTNVNLNVEVVNDATGAVVHSDVFAYGAITADSLAENQVFPIAFLPDDTQAGSYTLTYELTSDSTDADPSDNLVSHTFVITDSTFSKVPNINTQVAPGGDNNYTYGTHYYVYDATGATGEPIELIDIEFGCANITTAAPNMTGNNVDIYLYEWDDLDGNLQVGALGAEINIAALASYTFTGGEVNNTFIKVPMTDFNAPTEKLKLKSNTNYILAIQYTAPTANPTQNFFISTNDEIDYAAADLAAERHGVARISELLDVGNTGDLNGGFAGNNIPALRMNVAEIENDVSTNTVELAENALKVFPSPATDFINVDIELEELAKNVTITVYDVKGQLLQTKQMSNVKQDRATFNVSQFAAGSYLVNITTDDGIKTKSFTVVR